MNKKIIEFMVIGSSLLATSYKLEEKKDCINIDLNVVNNGYYFNVDVTSLSSYGSLSVSIEKYLIVEYPKTSEKSFSFSLLIDSGLLNYTGYKKLNVVYYSNDIDISKSINILGAGKISKTIDQASFEIVYAYDENEMIYSESIAFKENEAVYFPKGIKFDLIDFYSYYSDNIDKKYVSASLEAENEFYELSINYDEDKDKYILSKTAMLINSNDYLVDSFIHFYYSKFIDVQIDIPYLVYLKDVIFSEKNNDLFYLEFGVSK